MKKILLLIAAVCLSTRTSLSKLIRLMMSWLRWS